jgi:hypothetical protein
MAAISREIFLRLPRFHDKEIELLKELFPDDICTSLVQRLGFGPHEMFSIYESLSSFVPQAVADSIREVAAQLEAEIAASPALGAQIQDHPLGVEEATKQISGVLGFANLASVVSLTFAQIQSRTGIADERLHALLEALSINLDSPNRGLVKAFLAGDNPMRTRPFISRTNRNGQVEWLLVQPTWLVFGMRELFEAELSAKPMDQKYMKHRGELLERRGIQALVNSLRPEQALVNVHYVDADNKRFEADGLIIVGHVAIVVEAKSNRLTPYARSGAAERLWRELGPIITKAAEQADRLRALILDGTALHVRSSSNMNADGSLEALQRNWDLDTTNITDVFTIALSLEDLNYIATITSELVESGLIPPGTASPWIVNIHDLEITAELLSRPSEFVHFLSRRRKASDSNKILAADELDYVMHYITMGLYTDEPNNSTELVVNLTEDLDAWYFHKIGLRETQSPKPAQRLTSSVIEILDALDTHRPYGWLQTSFNLLEMDLPMRDRIGDEPQRLRALARKDRRQHSMYLEASGPQSDRFGFVAMSFPKGTPKVTIERAFLQYATLRQYASGLGVISAFASWQGSSSAFDIFLHLDGPWKFDQELDIAVTRGNLERSGKASILTTEELPDERPGERMRR